MVTDSAITFDLSIANRPTFCKKRADHLVTYKSGGRQSQVDFLMCRRQQLNEVKNYKVINWECGGTARSAGVGLGDQVQ